jgi:hypothetical protein
LAKSSKLLQEFAKDSGFGYYGFWCLFIALVHKIAGALA